MRLQTQAAETGRLAPAGSFPAGPNGEMYLADAMIAAAAGSAPFLIFRRRDLNGLAKAVWLVSVHLGTRPGVLACSLELEGGQSDHVYNKAVIPDPAAA